MLGALLGECCRLTMPASCERSKGIVNRGVHRSQLPCQPGFRGGTEMREMPCGSKQFNEGIGTN